MIPAHFPAMVQAELRAVFGRASGKAVLVVSFLVGLGAFAIMAWLQAKASDPTNPAPVINGMPLTAMLDFTAVSASGWALRARNFYVLPVLLLLAAAGSVAGELGDRSLREVLVRPVPRWSVLLAKLVALLALSWSAHALTLLPVLGLGAAVLGLGEVDALGQLLLGYGASWGSDLGILLIAFAVSVFVQSVGGVVVGVLLGLMADLFLRGVLWGVEKLGVAWAAGVGELMPGNALAAWEGWQGGAWVWQQGVGLLVLWGVAGAVAVLRFQRMDVP